MDAIRQMLTIREHFAIGVVGAFCEYSRLKRIKPAGAGEKAEIDYMYCCLEWAHIIIWPTSKSHQNSPF